VDLNNKITNKNKKISTTDNIGITEKKTSNNETTLTKTSRETL
jgi:hypothetical protein